MKRTLKNGASVVIREVQIEDAQILVEYMKIVNIETKNLMREPHEFKMTIEEEISFIEKVLKSNNQCMYLVFLNNDLISTAGFHGSMLSRVNHRVSIGISVLQAYNNLGVGSIVMEELISKAKEYHKTKIELEVRSDNPNAIHLYGKFGFKIEGYREDGFYVDDKFVGLTLMGLNLREVL